MSDSLNNKELVAVGHQFAKAMSSETPIMDIAKIVSRLAERLDCTTAALREMTKKRDADHADVLAWEKTMFKACGEDGLKSVAEKFAELQAKCAALASESAGLKAALECVINPVNQPEYHDQGMGCGVEDRGYQRDGYSACYYGWESAMERVYSEVIPDAIPETPATDAFLAEVRAQGVEMFAAHKRERQQALRSRSMRMSEEAAGMAADAEDFADQLRKGGRS